MDHMHGKTAPLESRLRLGHAEFIPVIIVNGSNDVPAAFMHIEKSDTDAPPRDATYLFNRRLHRFD